MGYLLNIGALSCCHAVRYVMLWVMSCCALPVEYWGTVCERSLAAGTSNSTDGLVTHTTLCVCMRVCVCIGVRVCVSSNSTDGLVTHTTLCVCMRVCVSVRVCACLCACVCVSVRVCACVHKCACLCVHVLTCMWTIVPDINVLDSRHSSWE